MKYLLLLTAVIMACASTLVASQSVVGTWFRQQEEDVQRVVTTEVTFSADGMFTQTIAFSVRGSSPASPAFSEKGGWRIEGPFILITLPSNAPVGVVERRDRVLKWRIEKLTEDELSVSTKDAQRGLEFRRRISK